MGWPEISWQEIGWQEIGSLESKPHPLEEKEIASLKPLISNLFYVNGGRT